MQHSIKAGFQFSYNECCYYKNEDNGVYNFYKNIIKSVPESKIILYNFSKLSGYTFTSEVTKRLIKDFPKNIVGMKDPQEIFGIILKLKIFQCLLEVRKNY